MATHEQGVEHLSGDGLRSLRHALHNRFKGDGVIDAAVDSVFREMQDRWDWSGGMATSEYEKLKAAFEPHVRRLLQVPLSDAKAAADALVRDWSRLGPTIKWL